MVHYLELLGIQWLKIQHHLVSNTNGAGMVTTILEKVPAEDIDLARRVLMWLCLGYRSSRLDELEAIVGFSQIQAPGGN